MARVANTTRPTKIIDPIEEKVLEYSLIRNQVKELETRQKELRDSLMEIIEENGYEDDQGHVWLEFDHEINGVKALQRTRKVTRPIDAVSAEEVLAGLGLWEQCTDLVRVVNDDAVMQALYDEELTEADVDCIYPPKITWALNVK